MVYQCTHTSPHKWGHIWGHVRGNIRRNDAGMPLTAIEAKNAKPRDKAYQLTDGGGLYLYILPSGGKSWRFKYRFGGKEARLTFGLYPEVSLIAARAKREEIRTLLREGVNPAQRAQEQHLAAAAAEAATFRSIAGEWFEDAAPLWSPSHKERVQHRLARDLYPAFGDIPIKSVAPQMVLKALRAIEQRGSIETAKRVKGYIVAIFRRAKSEQWVGADAVLNIIDLKDALRPNPPGSKQPSLITAKELLDFQLAVDRSRSDAKLKLASRLLALTAVRVGVLRSATWDEFEGIDWQDPDSASPDAMWRISAARMKLDVEDKGNEAFGHDVPLPHQAVETLRALRTITGQRALLLPTNRRWSEPISDGALSKLYKTMAGGKYKGRMVPHGWRSAFSTIMNERAAEAGSDGDRLIIDMMLAHVPKGASASEWAYNRARYLKPRRVLGQAWADIITDGLPSPWSHLESGDGYAAVRHKGA